MVPPGTAALLLSTPSGTRFLLPRPIAEGTIMEEEAIAVDSESREGASFGLTTTEFYRIAQAHAKAFRSTELGVGGWRAGQRITRQSETCHLAVDCFAGRRT